MTNNNLKIFLGALICSCSIFLAPHAFAAKIYFKPETATMKIGEVLPIEVQVDTEGQEINSVNLGISYPLNLLKLKEASEGGSIISYWFVKPGLDGSGVAIVQGGVVGGYNGKDGKLITLYFESQKNGKASIELDKASAVLLNDGKATAAKLTPGTAKLTIGGGVAAAPTGGLMVDTDPPQILDAVISQSPEVYGGKYFLAFRVRDEGSGVDYVEVKEGDGPFVRAESPYLLQNQKLDQDIFIRAVDKTGNVKLETFNMARSRWPEAVGGAVILLALGWFAWKKFKKS